MARKITPKIEPVQKQPQSNQQVSLPTDKHGSLPTDKHAPEFDSEFLTHIALDPQRVMRNEKGQLMPGSRLNPAGSIESSPAKTIAAWFRKQLAKNDPSDPSGRTRMERLFLNMFNIATNEDTKYRKEAVWAFNALMERAYGVPLKDQSELDALAKGGVTFVFTQPPVLDTSNAPEPLLLSAKPEFDDDGYEMK